MLEVYCRSLQAHAGSQTTRRSQHQRRRGAPPAGRRVFQAKVAPRSPLHDGHASTTMGFGELRHVRRRDVTEAKSSLSGTARRIRYRDRTIPMNAAALDSMLWILERWEKLGGE